MTLPGSITNNIPRGGADLIRRIENLERMIPVLQGERRLESASIGKGGLTIKGGKLTVQDAAGNVLLTLDGNGLTVDSDGTVTINGSLLVTGNLGVPNGSIDNDALAHPILPGQTSADNNSTNLTVAGANVAVATVSIPAGYTAAQVFVFTQLGNTRSASTPAPFYAAAWMKSPTGQTWASSTISATCAGLSSMSIAAGVGGILTGLTSGTLQLGVFGAVDSTAGWASGGANGHVDASIMFLR